MTKRYLGNIITQNPTAPAGNLQGSAAKGVWSLEEQLAYQKAGLWPVPGNFVDITDVFSTYLYTGNGSTQTITNGIDLDGEGGLVWIKNRISGDTNHGLFDTERGVLKPLQSNTNIASSTTFNTLTAFNSSGFSLGNRSDADATNTLHEDYVSWTFRKAPKFFTCLTYTGNSTNRTISHDLGSAPGMIIVKRIDNPDNWFVYHRSLGPTKGLMLNQTYGEFTAGYWQNTNPTSTEFSIFDDDTVNATGGTYVAYLFAHNDGDGGFGPDGSDIIKCGSYTGGGSTDVSVDLGFEPQWLLIKASSRANEWMLVDVMRGAAVDGDEALLIAEGSSAEFTGSNNVNITPTGFDLVSSDSRFNDTGETYIYISIRRGPLAQPTAGTEVFAMDTLGATTPNPPSYNAGFPVDLGIMKSKTSGTDFWRVGARLTGEKRLRTDNTDAEATDTQHKFDYQDGWYDAGSYVDSQYQSWMWKRAPGYFDVVAFDFSSGDYPFVNHNLGVIPEMIWMKCRNQSSMDWIVMPNTGSYDYRYRMYLNDTSSIQGPSTAYWANTAPTSTQFRVDRSFAGGSSVPSTSATMVAYLFASLPGISKVGSYTADGNAQNIDCGFTSGARFVLIKRTDTGGNWFVLDTARGIVSGNDPLLEFNSTGAEDNQYDNLDPYSAGFTVAAYGGTSPYLNISGGTYIFYAIA